MVKKLNKKQLKDLKKGQLPDDWWNYAINPVLGYRVKNNWKTNLTANSYPNPVKDERS